MSDYLPEDVIVKILRNLPVKSLVRFKCVCRRWRSIISDPLFATAHYNQNQNQKPPNRRLLLSSCPEEVELYHSLHLEAVDSSTRNRRLTAPYEPIPSNGGGDLFWTALAGSCNGLICLLSGFPYIWNPSTGMSHKFPFPSSFDTFDIEVFGFGYVSATDDYKVVVGGPTSMFGEVEQWGVFSLKSQVWKCIQSFPGCALYVSMETYAIDLWKGLLLNEALHWLTADFDILALDLASEQFRIMPQPGFLGSVIQHNFRIGVSGGSLYALLWGNGIFDPSQLAHGTHAYCIELWIMKEYGVSDSWTKLYNFSLSNQPVKICWLTPILVTKTSLVVEKFTREAGFELVRIEHEQGEAVDIQFHRHYCGDFYEIVVYEESLLWICDCYGVGDKVKRLKTKHEASGEQDEVEICSER